MSRSHKFSKFHLFLGTFFLVTTKTLHHLIFMHYFRFLAVSLSQHSNICGYDFVMIFLSSLFFENAIVHCSSKIQTTEFIYISDRWTLNNSNILESTNTINH
jgi:hypothetical protein